ncbi:hypothetical protein HYE82_29095 [Streptomyces sp. BR123]|uniref:TRADD-N-associated membrane domain-containing protein n=1 Tax=Streptomyces sp. BR123 TaxID=2749828 RepID=UPI0015C49BAA|nr:hypothetical protein [Streptomyces sp. BR123]NXY98358.1 hypothetical protein [Streptomyces sp. BR123]
MSFLSRWLSERLRSEASSESKRLRAIIIGPQSAGDSTGEVGEGGATPDGASVPRAGTQRIDDDKFAELLIEYYAWGLTQARRSTALSLTCSGLGVLVLLGGVVLGILKAETTGDLYAAAATSTSGAVSAVIGHLAHRRADKAMEHMRAQTESLRTDMRREREIEAAIRLLGEEEDPRLRSQLRAALVLKLASAEVPNLPMWAVPQARNGAAHGQPLESQRGGESRNGAAPA